MLKKVSPGGALKHFCEPPSTISIFHASTFTFCPPMPATLSTTVIIPFSLSRGHIFDISLSTPEGVSQCTKVAYLKSQSLSKKLFSSSMFMLLCLSALKYTGLPPYILIKSPNPSPKMPLSITSTLSSFSVKDAHAASSPRMPSPLNMRI